MPVRRTQWRCHEIHQRYLNNMIDLPHLLLALVNKMEV
jgi:hypothetical protein